MDRQAQRRKSLTGPTPITHTPFSNLSWYYDVGRKSIAASRIIILGGFGKDWVAGVKRTNNYRIKWKVPHKHREAMRNI